MTQTTTPPALCPHCSTWARVAPLDDIGGHHPNCPVNPWRVLELLKLLTLGIQTWGRDEDGVPDYLWPAYVAACEATGLPTPEARP